MDNMELDGEVQIYDAVKDLLPSDIESRVKATAEKTQGNRIKTLLTNCCAEG
ncbi:hypothetical protein [Thiothrix nivea]|uniref:Uncharacterized protein n=1 Tax=Thiothrix nivea (strain ATCC 35100 / DSM 5205 / JP2) TaxID=870187 RepID=A0A656HHN1_THINJ|nr:hypothetical protein [Thiothrix nivea]EIJ36438.1 hypothetical protein Thini_3938 [Thiothrix nivea DSM 5205]